MVSDNPCVRSCSIPVVPGRWCIYKSARREARRLSLGRGSCYTLSPGGRESPFLNAPSFYKKQSPVLILNRIFLKGENSAVTGQSSEIALIFAASLDIYVWCRKICPGALASQKSCRQRQPRQCHSQVCPVKTPVSPSSPRSTWYLATYQRNRDRVWSLWRPAKCSW